MSLRLRGSHPLCHDVPAVSTSPMVSHSSTARQNSQHGPTTPQMQRLPAITHLRFSLIRFRSPLLPESRLFSLPAGTEMFHFPTFPPHALCVQAQVPRHNSGWVSPFGHPRITARLSTPRGLSQTPTSFIGSRCQGIHHVHLVACQHYKDARVHYEVLKTPPAPHHTHTRPPPAQQDQQDGMQAVQPTKPPDTTPDASEPQQRATPNPHPTRAEDRQSSRRPLSSTPPRDTHGHQR